MRDTFDPKDIQKSDMKKLADAIDEYITMLTEVMIIPDEILEESGKDIKEAIARCNKLVKKLRKGDTDVFKDEDEWNHLG